MAREVKAQAALAGLRRGDVVLDFVRSDRKIAQGAESSIAISRINRRREHERETPVLQTLQDSRAQFALRQDGLGGHFPLAGSADSCTCLDTAYARTLRKPARAQLQMYGNANVVRDFI
jgi:hypothetical protein